MPNYAYKCSNENCDEFGQIIEIHHEAHDRDERLCNKCNKKLDKVFFVPNITLKDNMDNRRKKTSNVYNEINEMKNKLNKYKSSLKRGEYKE
jgi:predicted nucleic acid-binding Zn ribbon protein